ncbi:MAG: hypothetical protein LBI86_10460 [Treponema sp.]|jgi:hypothetical protein|nr:hypothetical protein [Treponema sp.]
MKRYVLAFLSVLLAFNAFAGGQTDSGRETSMDTIEAGKFVNPGAVDAYAYINDYVFPYEIDAGDDISIFVKLEKERILTIGDTFNLLIGLHVNNKDYFRRVEGNYIVLIHNPEILLRNEWKNSITAVLRRIRQAQRSDAVLGIFNPAANEIIRINTADSIPGILNQLQNTRKVYSIDTILDQSFKNMDKIENEYNTRFLWMTDSDLLKSSNDNSARTREYFDFLMKLQSQNNISFSYLGYGEVPTWATMNQSLKNVGGNSYYINGSQELEEKIWDDYDRFVYPTISNIKINVSLMPWIKEARYDYRSEWYPVDGFMPVTNYYTHTTSNQIKNMDSGEHKIYLYYLSIAAVNQAASDLYYRTVTSGGAVPVGFCSVEYYSYTAGKTKYRTFPLEIQYTEDYDDYAAHTDQSVRKYTVLQNTGFILKELSNLVNRRQYYTAILLVDSQIKILEKYLKEKEDDKITQDIELLNKNKDLLMEQAKSLNYIR